MIFTRGSGFSGRSPEIGGSLSAASRALIVAAGPPWTIR